MESTEEERQRKHDSWEGHIQKWKLSGLSQAEGTWPQCQDHKRAKIRWIGTSPPAYDSHRPLRGWVHSSTP